jgi:hypothetical protein
MGRRDLATLGLVAVTLGACGGTPSHGNPDASRPNEGDGATLDAPDDIASESSESEGGCISGGALTDGPSPLPEAGTCQNGWVASDPECPCAPTGFSQNCTAPGTRCFMPASSGGTISTDQECENEPGGYAVWVQYGLYTPGEFAKLPYDIDLDASDCTSRPAIPCDCALGQPTEGWLSTQVDQLSNCTYGNPVTFFAFTDDGCVDRIRYGGAPASADFASCMQGALANLRWACASSGTHFIDRDVVLPVGH